MLGRTIDLTRRLLERWDLHELIEYAHETGIISDSTKAATDQGRGSRNLIHPSKAMRLAKKCNRDLRGGDTAPAVLGDVA